MTPDTQARIEALEDRLVAFEAAVQEMARVLRSISDVQTKQIGVNMKLITAHDTLFQYVRERRP